VEQIKATRRWSLSADSKTLTIEITLNGTMGEYKSRRESVRWSWWRFWELRQNAARALLEAVAACP
jgi:hypothetical protein